MGDRTRATDLLSRALALAEREGHIRAFLNAGPALTRDPAHASSRTHPRVDTRGPSSPRRASAGRRGQPRSRQPLLDPLSERELDVLRLLDSDLSGPAIARELSVSVNTVRTHTQHVYTKLGVTNRREAVRRAARLGLLRRTNH